MLARWLRGVFDKETNVRGRDTHSLALQKLAVFQDIVFAMLPHAPEKRKRNRCEERVTPPKPLAVMGGSIITALISFCSHICFAKMDFEVRKGAKNGFVPGKVP